MIAELMRRAEQLAAFRQKRKVGDIAAELRKIFGAAAVHVEEARVLVSGRGAIKRWLIDPSLRFLTAGLK